MSQLITAPVPAFHGPTCSDPAPRLWTREEYYRLAAPRVSLAVADLLP